MKNQDQRFTKYCEWQKYILHPANCPDLRVIGYKRTYLVAYCLATASHGEYGLDCFPSDSTIAKEIGIGHRDTVTKYRHLALKLGWFVPNGKKTNHAEHLDIDISGYVPTAADLEQWQANRGCPIPSGSSCPIESGNQPKTVGDDADPWATDDLAA